MSIYDELINLQVMPDAFGEWADYRKQLTEYIIAHTLNGTKVAVFGAGSCNDIDLYELKEHFAQIVLLDKDKNGMQEALEKYQVYGCDKFKLVESDFVGIEPAEYREYSDLILKMIQVDGVHTDMNEVAQYAKIKMAELYEKASKRVTNFGTKEYDYVIAIGLHSQINNMFAWLWDAFCQAVGTYEESVFQFVMRQNDWIIEQFDNAFFTSARMGAIVGCEKKRIGQDGSVQGAVQALLDIERRYGKDELMVNESTQMRWTFDPKRNITYQMELLDIGV